MQVAPLAWPAWRRAEPYDDGRGRASGWRFSSAPEHLHEPLDALFARLAALERHPQRASVVASNGFRSSEGDGLRYHVSPRADDSDLI
jgi:hypothetical protein